MAPPPQDVQMVAFVSQVALGGLGGEPPAAQRFYGSWSSTMCDCFKDINICCPSFFCLPVYSTYQQARVFPARLGQLQFPFLGSVSGSDYAKYAVVVFVVVLILDVVATVMQGTTPSTETPSPSIEIILSVAEFLDIFWLFLVYRGVMARFQIAPEHHSLSFFKLCFCRCCTLAQVFRHVQDYGVACQGQALPYVQG